MRKVIDLSTAREELRIPTQVIALLAERVGADARIVHPGLVEAVLPGGTVSVRIRTVNVFRGEAEAYRLAGLPVPSFVLEDIERWDRRYGSLA